MRILAVKLQQKVVATSQGTELLLSLIPTVTEGTVVAIVSKLFSILTNCRLAKSNRQSSQSDQTKPTQWQQLLQRESAGVFPSPQGSAGYCLTLKMGRLLVNAGIDHSNSVGDYLLLPHNLQQLVVHLWQQLKKRDRVQKIGIIVTDSVILPLRKGVMGVALAWCGIEALFDYTHKTDLDGNPMEVTAINVIDSLATAATLVMGEGAEQTPLAIITELDEHVTFMQQAPSERDLRCAQIAREQDLYSTVIAYDKMDRGQLAEG